MSPSKTIHLGPLWLILASSRMMLEKRPVRRWTLHINLCVIIQQCVCHTVITIFPLPSCWIDDAEQLIIGHSFWVKVRPHRFAFHIVIGPLQWPHHLTLSCACIPNNKNRVTNGQQLLQLHHLTHKHRNEIVFMLCFLCYAWRALLTVINAISSNTNSTTVSLAFHGPVNCNTLLYCIFMQCIQCLHTNKKWQHSTVRTCM